MGLNDSLKRYQINPYHIRRSAKISQAHERYGFYADVKGHKLEDHNEPANYKAAFSDPEFDKWVEAVNAK